MQKDLFLHELDKSTLSPKDLIKFQEQYMEPMITVLRLLHRERRAIFIPGNTPSLKNSKEIMQIPTKQSACCSRWGGTMVKLSDVWSCSKCKKPAQRLFRATLMPSKAVQKFQKEKVATFKDNLPTWKEMAKDIKTPYRIGYYFIRESMRVFDYINAAHIIQDEMAKYGYYEDDNMNFVVPEFLGYHYNKEKPGCIITLANQNIELEEIKRTLYENR